MPAAPARLPSAGVRAASANPGGSSGNLPSPSAGSGYASPFSPARTSSLGPAGGGSSTPAVLSRAGSSSVPASATSPSRRQPSGLGSSAVASDASSGTAGAASGTSLGRPRGASRPASGRSTAAAVAAATAGGGAGGPAASLAGLDPELQQSLEAAALQLASREWKERLSGLEALQQGLPGVQAPGVPAEAQLWAASQLAQRVVDANLKVQQQVGRGGRRWMGSWGGRCLSRGPRLSVLCLSRKSYYSWHMLLCYQPASIPHAILLQALVALNALLVGSSEALAPAAPALVPAVCKGLDSGNPSVRQVGV